MNEEKIRELKVDELENVAGGSVIWGSYRPSAETKDLSWSELVRR
jgi:hypothetical protein